MRKQSFDSTEFLSKVGKGKTLIRCHKGDVIFAQGDVANAVFFIHDGSFKLSVVSQRGKEAVVGLLESGQSISDVSG